MFAGQILHDAKVRVQGGLQALDHVQQLLYLGLQLNNFLRNRVRRDSRGCKKKNCGRNSKQTIASNTWSLHSQTFLHTRYGSPAMKAGLPSHWKLLFGIAKSHMKAKASSGLF